ncbi:MAG: hypothetical protein QF447_07810 [Candidatus Thioglobus sp.]|nr:hypothetical protein [Candidatus Thioglobus sp.]
MSQQRREGHGYDQETQGQMAGAGTASSRIFKTFIFLLHQSFILPPTTRDVENEKDKQLKRIFF